MYMNDDTEDHRVLLVNPNDLTDAYLAGVKTKYIAFYEKYKNRTFVEYETGSGGDNGYHFSNLIDPDKYKLDDIFYIYKGNLGMRFLRNKEIPTLLYINNFRPLKENFQVIDGVDISVYYNDENSIDNQVLKEFRSLFGKTPLTNSGGSSRRKTKRRKPIRHKTRRRKTKKTKRKNRY